MRLRPGLVVVVALSTMAVAPLVAPAREVATAPTAIEFPRGTSSTTVHGGIARGEALRYMFTARADQWVELALGSVEGNAVASVYGPGWRIGAQGEVLGGDALAEIGEDAGTKEWSDLLPSTGTYLLELGTTRGGAEFDLNLALRAPTDDDCGELQQGPMNVCFGALARLAEAERARAYASLEALLDKEERVRLAAAERAWRAYLEAECDYEAAPFEGGTLQPTIYSNCRTRLTAQRQTELESQRQGHDER